MKRSCFLTLFIALVLAVSAQTQQGIVKTKGRMVNGKHVAGQGLSAATVTILEHGAVLTKTNGSFSFPVTSKTFMVKSVKKQGYQLVDAEVLTKPYQYSSNPVCLVMERPEQQLEDLLLAQEKVNQGLKRLYQESMAENRRLREENRISEEEYQKNLNRIISEQKNREKLIKDMSERYAKVDYDQLDEFSRRVNDYILNGELMKADSMLKTKGDMTARAATIQREWQMLNVEKGELSKRQKNVDEVRSQLQAQMNELAADCYSKSEIFKMQFMTDSAMFYLKQRAELDTMNTAWMYEYAYYCYDYHYYTEAIGCLKRILAIHPEEPQPDTRNLLGVICHVIGRYEESITYFENVLEYRRKQYAEDATQASRLATALMNLGNAYKAVRKVKDAEQMYQESVGLKRKLAKDIESEFDLATTLHNQGDLFVNNNRYAEAEACFSEAAGIYRRCISNAPQNHDYEHHLAHLLRVFGALYNETQRLPQAFQMVQESVSIYQRLAKENPQKYELPLSWSLSVMSVLYKESRRMEDYEKAYLQILNIRRHYAKEDPALFGASLVAVLDTLATYYMDSGRMEQHDTILMEKVQMCRYLIQQNPQRYEPILAWDLRALAMHQWGTHSVEGMAMCREAVEIYERLARSHPQAFEFYLADILSTYGDYCSEFNLNNDGEDAYLQSIHLFRNQEKDYPQIAIPSKAISMYSLGLLYYNTSQWAKSLDVFKQVSDIYRELTAQNSEKFRGDLMSSFMMIARVFEQQKDYDQCVAYCLEALTIAKSANDSACQAKAYVGLSFYSLFQRNFEAAENYARMGLQADSSQTMLYTNLAPALLLQGRTDEAIAIYRQAAAEHKTDMLSDFDLMEKEGVIPLELKPVVEKVKRILEES